MRIIFAGVSIIIFAALLAVDIRSFWDSQSIECSNYVDYVSLGAGEGSVSFHSTNRSDSKSWVWQMLPSRKIDIDPWPMKLVATSASGWKFFLSADGQHPIAQDLNFDPPPPVRGNWTVHSSTTGYDNHFFISTGEWRSVGLFNDPTSNSIWLGIPLTDHTTYIWLPLWPLVVIAGIVSFLVSRSAWKHRHPRGHCRHCGYDLRASPLRCPECGTTVAVNVEQEAVPSAIQSV